MTNPSLLEWAKAEQALRAREQAEESWKGGTNASWRAVAQFDGGVYYSRAKRLEISAREGRIAVKCRLDVQNWRQVIAMLEGEKS